MKRRETRVRLLAIAFVVATVAAVNALWLWLLLGALTVGALVTLLKEWNEYRHDQRPAHLRYGDVFDLHYAVEVVTGWWCASLLGAIGVIVLV